MSLRSPSLSWCLTLGTLLVGLTFGCGDSAQPPIPPPSKQLPDAAKSSVELSRTSNVRADGADEVSITVTVRKGDGVVMADRTVMLEVSGEGNTLRPASGKTNTEGVMTAKLVSTRGGAKQVTARVQTDGEPVVLSSRPTVEFVALQPKKLAFTAMPLEATAGALMSPVLEVSIQDETGATVREVVGTVTLELASGPGGGQPEGSLTVSAVDGVARFPELLFKKAGTGYSLRATSGALTAATSPLFDVVPAAASVLELSGLPASMTAGDTTSVDVTVKDAFGNLATNYRGTLRFSSTDGFAPMPAEHTFTEADAGRKTFTGLSLQRAGTQRVTVTDSVNPGLTVEAEVQVGAAATFRILFNRHPLSRFSVRAAMSEVEVIFLDRFENVTAVSGPAVSLALNPASGVLGGTTTLSPVDGRASFTDLSVTHEGTGYTLVATAGTFNSATSSAFNIVDDVAPAAPQLSQGTTAPTSIEVRWTAVGDDGVLGTATSQELRYSASNIVSDADFAAATPVATGTPQAGGSAEQATLTGLTPGSNYYVALKVTDSAGNSVRSATLPVSTPNPTVTQLVFTVQPVDTAADSVLPELKVALRDINGDTVTSATSAVTLTLRGGPTLTRTVNAVAGVASFPGLSITTAGTGYFFEATVGGTVPTAQSNAFAILPAAANHLELVGLVAPVGAGQPGSVQVTAYDAFNNIASGYRGTVRFTSNDAAATLPADFTFAAGDAGRKVFTNGVVLRTAGSRTVTVADTVNGTLTDSLTVDVVNGAATQLVLTASAASVTAGSPFSLEVTLRDSAGNIAIDYTGTVSFTSTETNGVIPSDYTFTALDAGQKTFSNVELRTAGPQSITARDIGNASLTDTESLTVNAAAVVSLAFSAPANATAGTAFSVTVSAIDTFNNVVSGYTGTVSFSSDDTQATLPANYTFTPGDAGSRMFSATFGTAGTQPLRVSDGTRNASASILVAPGAATRLALTGLEASLTAGTSDSVDVTAYDAFNNVATGYTGTVRFTSTDPAAVLPPNYTFTASDSGTQPFLVELRTGGPRVIAVTDTGNAALTDDEQTNVVAGSPAKLVFSQQPTNGTVRSTLNPVSVTLVDAYDNTTTATAPQVTVSLLGGGGNATLSGTRTVSPAGGVATFSALSIDQEATDFQLAASADDLIGATSTVFTVVDNLSPDLVVITATQSSATSVTVAWMAVGDDGSLGRASSYQLRYSTSPINSETDFASATEFPTGAPQNPGTSESVLVTGLTLDNDLYFALKVLDGAGNFSRSEDVMVGGSGPCSGVTCTPPATTCSADGTSVVSYTSACQEDTGTCQDTPTTTRCQSYETCSTGACVPVTPGSQAGQILISEFSALGSEFIELHNTTGVPLDVHGFTLRNAAGQMVTLRAVTDPNGTAGTPVTIGATGYLYGVANPSGAIPPGVGFVYGDPGTSFALADTGDALALYSAAPAGNLQDAVDFRSFVTNPDVPLTAADFVGFAGSSTQLDLSGTTAGGNDTATNWCVSFYEAGQRGSRITHSRGGANGRCKVAVINELFIDPSGGDDGKGFIEIAGPGGSVIGGARLIDVEGKGAQAGQPNTAVSFTFPAGTRIPADGILLVADAALSGVTLVPNFVNGVDVKTATLDPENNGGDSIQLVSAAIPATLLDAVGYDPAGANLDTNVASNGLAMYEGATALYLGPNGNSTVSLVRSPNSTDTDNNRNDFRSDPSSTPGLPNDTINLTVTGMTPDDAPSIAASTVVTVMGTDFGPGMRARFGTGAEGPCTVLGPTEATCTAAAGSATPTRVDVLFKNNVAIGTPDLTVGNAFTFTGSLNETGNTDEADYCNLQFPASFTVTTGQATPFLYGQLYEAGVTDGGGAPAGWIAEVGYGPTASSPLTTNTWRFFSAVHNTQVGNNDEFVGSFVAPAAGSYSYTFRFSSDNGIRWTYCDLNGAGSNTGVDFQTTQLGAMTVSN
ncbi:Ig-like domain-containing protein [Hyalangium rubrum]|uniref:Ig-like domain-containing protein n=1 Tax=Hyalangium rubrum TaxID=3103134 RepID=A0ABU5HE71_9BACT|nr:Ig-like domain-containing protein [Hyalangium sp. s54d21]MDY7231414.1 Ig-like domain-containing protein [Hyalangium sp. s54d21]